MNLKQVLARARETLAAGNIEEAPLEGELLLRHALGINRVQLYQELSRELSPEQEETFWQLIQRRLQGEPSAYITGHREFYGIDFHVDPRVLIPRPESELLVEMAVKIVQNSPITTIADIGTGCGAIAISLAVNLPKVKLYATDISAPALKVARLNCRRHTMEDRICLLQGNMLDPLPEPVDLIIANMPYVKESEIHAAPLRFEPSLALDGGTDGLEKLYALCKEAGGKLCPRGYLLLEVGQGQANPVAAFLHSLYPSAQIEVTPDFAGIERVVGLRLTQNYPDDKIYQVSP